MLKIIEWWFPFVAIGILLFAGIVGLTVVDCVRFSHRAPDYLECESRLGEQTVEYCGGHGCDHPEVCAAQRGPR